MAIEIDEAKVEHGEISLWFGWTVVTIGGMLLGFLLSIPLINVPNLGFAPIIAPVRTGAIIGFSQWIVHKPEAV
jgi:hypothetical protein